MPESQERQYEVFLRVAARLQEIDDLQAQLDEIARGVVEARTYRRALFSLLDDSWNVIQIGSAGVEEEELERIRQKPALSPEERRRLLDEQYQIGDSYFIPQEDVQSREVLKDALPSHLLDSDFVDWHPDDVLFVPLYGRQRRIIGTLSVDDPWDGRRPTAQSLRILELFAREAAVTIETSMLNSELRRVRAYLETLIESVPDAIVTLDQDGNVVLFNSGASRITGFKPEEVIGRSVVQLFASEAEAKGVMLSLRSRKPGEEPGRISGQEILFRSKSGEEIPGSLSASLLYDSDGNEIGSAGISKDLRPLRKLEQELVKAEKIATVGEVATLLSHEVNNFLASILSACELSHQFLRSKKVTRLFREAGLNLEVDKEKYRLKVIQEEALRIGSITEKLQRMAKGKEYETTSYMSGISMLDVDQSIEKMTTSKEVCVLIADDKLYIRKFLREILEKEGFVVDDAEDGEVVLKKAAERVYDLVISDIRMPNKNGYEVAIGLKESSPDLPVILITAYGYDPSHSAVRARKEGNIAAVLYKPFDLGKLKEAIQLALSKQQT